MDELTTEEEEWMKQIWRENMDELRRKKRDELIMGKKN